MENNLVTDKVRHLLRKYSAVIKPEQKQSVTEWARKYVSLQRSNRSEKADLDQTPWLTPIIEQILGNSASEIVVLAPTGGGKSTLIEIALTYIVAEKPSPVLVCSQSDPDAYEWFQTGILPAFKKCDLIKEIFPKKKNLIRKDFIQFPSMPFYIGGANHNNLQSKSCDYVFLDEAWCYKEGLIQEARRRTHDRFNSKVVIASQAGNTGDDLDIAWGQSYKHEFAFQCTKCKEYVPYQFEHIKFDCDKFNDDYVWETLVAYYECPHCNHKYDDSVTTRRSMCNSGKYINVGSDNPIKNHIGYHFSALNVWWISWSKIVIEFLKANQYVKMGNINYLRQFNQKRLAKSWSDYNLGETSIVELSDYKKEEAPQWDITLLTVDVQKQDLWYCVRTWAKSGDSRLIESGKVLNWRDLEAIQKKYSIKDKCVFLDAAYRTEEVKNVIAKYKWLGLNGRFDAFYTVKNPRTQKTIKRLFSAPNRYTSANGQAIITYYSSNGVKDILFILKAGHGAEWGVPTDVDQEYLDQLNSEIKIIGPNNVPTYKAVSKNNHLLDCEVMQICGAMMHNVYPTVIAD